MEATLSPARLIELNKCPAKKQEEQIREAIPRLQEDVRRLQVQYDEADVILAILYPATPPEAHLTERLARLRIELDSAKDELAAHVTCLSYALRLPVEVLEEIFIMTLPNEHYIKPDRLKVPLLLCQVCSMWRKVAVVTPALWHRLSIKLTRPRGAWKDLFETWLGRSGSAFVNLALTGGEALNAVYFNEHALKHVAAFSERWRRLRLEVPPSSLRALLRCSVPNLKILEVKAESGNSGVFLSYLEAPRLRNLVLLAGTNPSWVYVGWEQLTFLRVKHPLDWDKAVLLLAQCKNLQECAITLSSDDRIGTNIPPRLRMDDLRRLILCARFGGNAANDFFDLADFPCLDMLELVHTGFGTYGFGPESSLASFARRANLRKLLISAFDPLNFPDEDKPLRNMVASIPSLEDVVFSNRG